MEEIGLRIDHPRELKLIRFESKNKSSIMNDYHSRPTNQGFSRS